MLTISFQALLRGWLTVVALVMTGSAAVAYADSKTLEPDRLEEGWNLPAPPLPSDALEGTVLKRTVKVRRSDSQPTTDAWLKAQLTALELDIDGRVVPFERSGTDFVVNWTVPAAGEVKAKLRARTPSGVREGPVVALKIHANVKLKVAVDKLDFGPVAGGCSLQQHCKVIDLGPSQQLRGGQKLAVSRPALQPGGAPGWAELLVHVRSGGVGQPLIPIAHGAPAALVDYAADKTLEVCYSAPKCRPVPDKPAEALLVQPVGKGLIEADRAAHVVLLATVAANPMWECYLPWILAVLGAIVALFVALGILKPHKFPPSAMLFVGAQESQLARDSGRPLYSAPGGRKGFYRSAACTFDPSGMTVRRGAGGVLVLHAVGKDIALDARTEVEVKERQRWRVLPATDRILQRGVVHRVGKAFFFRID